MNFMNGNAKKTWSLWRWLAAICVPPFAVWSLAGFFMEGEDELERVAPWVVVLGGGVAGERLELACQLFRQGHGWRGVVLPGVNAEHFVPDRAAYLKRCGIPGTLINHWPHVANTFEEVSAVAKLLSNDPGSRAIVVSNPLHMPRLRYLRDKLALNDRLFFRQSRLGGRWDPDYLYRVVVFWFREPLAYVYYRVRY